MSNEQLIASAKCYAKEHGHKEGPGGWIFNRAGKPLCRGWVRYAEERAHLIAFEHSLRNLPGLGGENLNTGTAGT